MSHSMQPSSIMESSDESNVSSRACVQTHVKIVSRMTAGKTDGRREGRPYLVWLLRVVVVLAPALVLPLLVLWFLSMAWRW